MADSELRYIQRLLKICPTCVKYFRLLGSRVALLVLYGAKHL